MKFFDILVYLIVFFGKYTELLIFPFIITCIVYQYAYINKIEDNTKRQERRQQFLYIVLISVAMLMTIVFLKLPALLNKQNEKLRESIQETRENMISISDRWDQRSTFFADKIGNLINGLYTEFDATMTKMTKDSRLFRLFYGGRYRPPDRSALRDQVGLPNVEVPNVQVEETAPESSQLEQILELANVLRGGVGNKK